MSTTWCSIDRLDDPDDPEIITADLEILDDDWITHFHGVDTVVHLAANTDEHASWDDLIGPNLDVLANVFHAAALAGVERVVFASSNHVMGERRTSDDEPIGVDSNPMPDGPYAVTKLVGERLGQSLAPGLRHDVHRAPIGPHPGRTESARDSARRMGPPDVALQRRPDPPVRLRRRGRDR